MKDVVISINSTHGYDTDNEDTMDFTTDGRFSFDNGVGSLVYYESEVTGLEGTRTKLLIQPDEIAIDREGSVTSHMVFREGLKSAFQYETPYGMANMGINTKKIINNMDKTGGSVEIEYIVDMEHAVVVRNRFKISVSEINYDRV